jgi:hypothetical protein
MSKLSSDKSNPNMVGNAHAQGAAMFAGWSRNEGIGSFTPQDLSPESVVYRELAQTQATMAVAYEQRTANLLSFLTVYGGRDRQHVVDEVKARLGLTP